MNYFPTAGDDSKRSTTGDEGKTALDHLNANLGEETNKIKNESEKESESAAGSVGEAVSQPESDRADRLSDSDSNEVQQKNPVSEEQRELDRKRTREGKIRAAWDRVEKAGETIGEDGHPENLDEAISKEEPWVQRALRQRLEVKDSVPRADLEKLIDRRLDEQEARRMRTDLVQKNQLNSADESRLESESQRLRVLGLPPSEAFSKAAAICGFSAKSAIVQAREEGIKLGRLALPPSGRPPIREKRLADKGWNEMNAGEILTRGDELAMRAKQSRGGA